ncbi:MAG TPA: serine/threonine-protein kinase [Polyangiaceae bacterium]
MAEGPDPGLRGKRLGEYEVVAPISQGGMASVWLGKRSGRPADFVAVKVIRPEHARNKEFVAMLVDEAGIASRLSHPNIPVIHAFGESSEEVPQPYLVMELLRGHTLLETFKAMHARGKRFAPEIVAWIGARVADALHYAHELTDDKGAPLQVVHRDVNPANIFLTSEGVPKLIDFGLAKARDRIASTAIGVVKGKLAYLAPEQAHGKPADRRSDVFALGITLWELSLDRRLFLDETDVQTVRRVREAEVPDPGTLDETYPPELAELLLRALAKEPEKRWQTAAELRDGLDAFAKSRQPKLGAMEVRALLTETFAGTPPAEWERSVEEAISEHEATRAWDERKPPPGQTKTQPLAVIPPGPPSVAPPAPNRPKTLDWSPRLLGAVAAIAALGGILGGVIVRGCGGRDGPHNVERRLARLEDLLGVASSASAAQGSGSPAGTGSIASADEPPQSCPEAKIASYLAWQEALAKAKTLAQPAEAACADMWSDTRKQACYHTALAEVRATQAARDSVIAGGAAARDAVKGVKDDAKNEAIAHARAVSLAAFDSCGETGP